MYWMLMLPEEGCSHEYQTLQQYPVASRDTTGQTCNPAFGHLISLLPALRKLGHRQMQE